MQMVILKMKTSMVFIKKKNKIKNKLFSKYADIASTNVFSM